MYLPLFIDLAKSKALIVGGGEIAFRKAKILAEAEISITLLSPKRIDHWQEIEVNWLKEEYSNQDLRQYNLVVAATDNKTINSEIIKKCKALGILCNCASKGTEGNVIFPGTVKENGITVAISTEGKTPFLTKKLKSEAQQIVSQYDDNIISLLGEVRKYIIENLPSRKEELLKKLGETPINAIKEKGNIHEITDWLQRK